MEVMRRRVLVLSASLAALGAYNLVQVRPWSPQRSERWMEDRLPTVVDGLAMRPSRSNPRQSYRTDETTYRMLRPYGIVNRVFGTRQRAYDAVVIAGSSLDCFHDPAICLPMGGWPILASRTARVPTRTRGEVPMTVMTLRGPDGGLHHAAFCYRGAAGFRSDVDALRWDWFQGELANEHAQEGAFYRFVQLRGTDSDAAFESFVRDYLDRSSV